MLILPTQLTVRPLGELMGSLLREQNTLHGRNVHPGTAKDQVVQCPAVGN